MMGDGEEGKTDAPLRSLWQDNGRQVTGCSLDLSSIHLLCFLCLSHH